jgi:predicted patatin/cPLA2 family phospholipase
MYDIPTKNLVLSGGHLNGFVYINFFKYLNKFNTSFYKNIENIVTISIGSLFGLFYILNIDLSSIKWGDTISFNDYRFDLLFSKYGLNTCDNLINYLKNILIEHDFNPDLTLKDIYLLTNKKLHILCTNIENNSIHSFNKDNNNLKVMDIVRMAITIPIIMTVKKYKNVKYIDCALTTNMVSNFIHNNFNFINTKTLWLEIITRDDCNLYFKNKQLMFFMKIFNYLINRSFNYNQENNHTKNDIYNTFVFIELDTIVNIFNLNITNEEYLRLSVVGKKIFFDNYLLLT